MGLHDERVFANAPTGERCAPDRNRSVPMLASASAMPLASRSARNPSATSGLVPHRDRGGGRRGHGRACSARPDGVGGTTSRRGGRILALALVGDDTANMGRALGYRLRADVRRSLPSVVALAVLIAVLGGMTLATLAGAFRTSTAYDRFLEEVNAPELLISPPGGPGADPRPFYAAVADLPGVRGVRRLAGMPLVAQAEKWSERPVGPLARIGVHAPVDAGSGGVAAGRPRLVAGRLPDPSRAEEVLVSERLATASGLGVGDRIDAVLLTSAQAEAMLVASPDDGPAIRLVVTGIGVLYDEVIPFSDLNSQGSMVGTAALAAMSADPTDWYYEGAHVDLDPGFDPAAVAASIEELALRPELGTGGPVFISDEQASTEQVSDALQPLAVGLLVAAGAIAVVAMVVAGQAVGRVTRAGQEEVAAHRAIGLRPVDRVVFALARAACIGVLGALGAVTVATLGSGLFPIGIARAAEPHPGLRVDAPVLLVGGVGLVLVTTVSALPAALLGLRTRVRAVGASRLTGVASAGRLSPAAAQGVRFALVGGGARSIPMRSTLTAVTFATTAVLATAAFGASLTALIETPERYGQQWDRMIDGQFGPAPAGRIVERMRDVDEVQGIAGGTYGDVSVEGVVVPGFDLEDLKGSVSVGIVEGRPARQAGEIVLGGETMDQIGLSVGDTAQVDVGSGPTPMQVTGRGVFPHMQRGSFTRTGLGVGAQLPGGTLETFADTEVPPDYAYEGHLYTFVMIDAGGDTAALDLALDELRASIEADGSFAFLRQDQQPTRIRDLDRVRVVPGLMAGVLAVVAVAALAHLLVTSVRARRAELALLRALGFSRRQLRAAVAWQASVIAVLAAVIGVPLGIALGRLIWGWFEEGLHAAAPAETPWSWAVVTVPVLLLVANLVAAIPGRAAGRTSPASILRDD